MRVLFTFFAALLFCAVGFAQEAGAAAIAPSAGGGVMEMLTPIVIAVIGMAFGWLRMRQQKAEDAKTEADKKSEEERIAERQALATLEKSVAATYLSYVRPLKKSGKGFDHKEARRRAFVTAKGRATSAAKAVYELWGDDLVDAAIHRIANRQGADKPSSAPKPEAANTDDVAGDN